MTEMGKVSNDFVQQLFDGGIIDEKEAKNLECIPYESKRMPYLLSVLAVKWEKVVKLSHFFSLIGKKGASKVFSKISFKIIEEMKQREKGNFADLSCICQPQSQEDTNKQIILCNCSTQ